MVGYRCSFTCSRASLCGSVRFLGTWVPADGLPAGRSDFHRLWIILLILVSGVSDLVFSTGVLWVTLGIVTYESFPQGFPVDKSGYPHVIHRVIIGYPPRVCWLVLSVFVIAGICSNVGRWLAFLSTRD